MCSAATHSKLGFTASPSNLFHTYAITHTVQSFSFAETLRVLMEARPKLSMTTDISNTTFFHTTATQGNIDVMNYLLEIESSLASIKRTNRKTTSHSASRNGHYRVVEALLEKARGILARNYKGQTALRVVAKG